MVQLSNPNGTLFNQWTIVGIGGSTAHSVLSDGIDNRYIWSATTNQISVGNSTSVLVPAPGGPVKFRIRYRAWRPGFTGGLFVAQMGSNADGIVASRNLTINNTEWLTQEWTLSGAELALLTDWANLAWRFVWQSGSAIQTRVTMHQIEVPDPAVSKGWWHPRWQWA